MRPRPLPSWVPSLARSLARTAVLLLVGGGLGSLLWRGDWDSFCDTLQTAAIIVLVEHVIVLRARLHGLKLDVQLSAELVPVKGPQPPPFTGPKKTPPARPN